MIEFSEAMRSFTGLTVLTVMFLGAAGALVACNRTVERGARNVFLACLAALACIASVDWFMTITNGIMPELRLIHSILMALTFAVAPVLPVAIANTICSVRDTKWMTVFLAAHAVFELVGIAGGYVFWVDADNAYHRGMLYSVYMAVYTVASLYLVVKTIQAARAYQTAQVATVFGILACMFAGVLMQVLDGAVRMTWPAASMAVVLYFVLYSDMVLRTDPLTKLLNRRSFEDALSKPHLPAVAAIIDVDDFKHVNDAYGHVFGDECLARVAQMLRRAFGGAGLCYRTGGDEFAVIMTKRLTEVEALCDELARLTAEAQRADERMPTLSVGYAEAGKDCQDLAAVFEIADQRMYQAKRDRKTRHLP